MRPRAVAVVLAALAGLLAGLLGAGRPGARHVHARGVQVGTWSAAATLARCSGTQAPQVVFPAKTPFHGTGEGAIVFAGSRSCPRGEGALIAAIGSRDIPRPPRGPRTPSGEALALVPPLDSAATTKGQIVLIGARGQGGPGGASQPGGRGARASGSASGAGMLSEGPAGGPFTAPMPLPGRGSPLGLATAYLGDVAIASERDDPSFTVQLRMQRWRAHGFGTVTRLGGLSGARRALAVALDYRTDALAVWWQHGWLWARERHANGALGPLQRFARTGAHVQLTTLISDDGRALVAWVDPSGDTAKLYLDVSAPFMRLGPGVLLERLRWRAGDTLPPSGSVRLVRLSTESVLMAWTGTQDGHFVVRAAGIDLQGVRTTSTVSSPGEDARLESLATGPRGDAIALWRAAPVRPAPGYGDRAALMAARGVPSSRGVPRFAAPQQLASAGLYSDASVALDPDSDRAVASWREQSGAIRWAVRSVGR